MNRARALATTAGAAAFGAVVAAVALAMARGWTLARATEAFVTTNCVIALGFAACGLLLAWHRPRNVIGWLFLGAGAGHATTALMAPLADALAAGTAPEWAGRAAMTAYAWAWPWSIGLALPVALLLFPDGRPPGRRWRWVVGAVVATAPLFVLEIALAPEPFAGLPVPLLTVADYARWAPLWLVAEVRTVASLAAALVALVVRYRRGDETLRRQLLWLVAAAGTLVVAVVPWSFVAGTPVFVLFAIPLVPIAVTVAVLRHQLLDIRLVLSRALSYALLSAVVVGAYAALVAVLDLALAGRIGRPVAVVVVALCVTPVRDRLQRQVDRAMYGDRADPVRAASRLAEQLTAERGDGLDGVVGAVREALRLPYAAITVDAAEVAAAGRRPATVHTMALSYGGRAVGDLAVGLRPGERALSPEDDRVLALVAAPLAVAVHATRLAVDLQESREQLVTAREEERRRLRRDLHDGLGPVLTGIAYTADAAANLIGSDPERSAALLAALCTDARAAIADVRRVVDDLRPPALDELGLVGALRQRVDQLSRRADGPPLHVALDVAGDLPALPAAIEVAAYRIATEAVTNSARHSAASSVVVRLRCTDRLDIEVVDDGGPANGEWRPGVGLQAMRERAAELGGSCQAGPTRSGGRVYVSLPVVAS